MPVRGPASRGSWIDSEPATGCGGDLYRPSSRGWWLPAARMGLVVAPKPRVNGRRIGLGARIAAAVFQISP